MYSCSKDQRPNSCDKTHRTLPPIPQCDIINSTLIYWTRPRLFNMQQCDISDSKCYF